jgi:hypothetical protein
MNATRVGAALFGALLLASCKKDGGPFFAPDEPLAYVRLIHSVPDTSATDWRFVDAVKNSPFALSLAFRGFTPYQATTPGPRHLRIFPACTAASTTAGNCDINLTSQIMIDTTLTFEEGKYYTLVHVGLARAGGTPADRIVVFSDDAPSITGTNIALRVVNLGPGLNTGAPGSVDVFATAATGDPLPSSAFASNVAFLGSSAYATRAVGSVALRATAAGTTTPVLANVAAPVGAAADPALSGSAIGGSGQAGSALTAFVFPRSTAGSAAPQTTAFTTPTIVYIVDRRP